MPPAPQTAGAWVRHIQQTLVAAGAAPAPREGHAMVQRALGWDDLRMVVDSDAPVPLEISQKIGAWLERRQTGEPLAYVLGGAWFMGRWWSVGPGVLIPRPDTETLVMAALERLPQGGTVVEVGTGSGAVLGSLLLERMDATGIGVDIDPLVVLRAGQNLTAHEVGTRAELRTGDLLAPVEGPVDMMVSNPPYIADDEWLGLERDVRDFEPRLALVGMGRNADGLEVYRDLVPQAVAKIRPGGWLVMEIGWQQAQGVQNLLPETVWSHVTIIQDLAGRDRAVAACRR